MSTDASLVRPVRRPGRGTASAAGRVGSAVKWVLVAIGVVVAVVPFLWMLSVSFRTEQDLFANPASLLPQTWTLHGYIGVWEQLPNSTDSW